MTFNACSDMSYSEINFPIDEIVPLHPYLAIRDDKGQLQEVKFSKMQVEIMLKGNRVSITRNNVVYSINLKMIQH